MNYWERHIGDYARDAGHLTMLEHGAYTLLLDRYYSTEQGIPAAQAHRICRAQTKPEREAVDAVLAEFFQLVDGLWVNGRAAQEIAKAQTKINAARTNGARGGRPKKNPGPTEEKPTGFSMGSVSETQAKAHQTPDTSHQTKEQTHSDATTVEVTAAGRVCLAMRKVGLQGVNPGHPDLLALIEAGATDAEFVGAAQEAAKRDKGFAYALGMLKGQRKEAHEAKKSMARGAMPADRRSRQLATAAALMGALPTNDPDNTIEMEAADVHRLPA